MKIVVLSDTHDQGDLILTEKHLGNVVPMCNDYCGFHLFAETICFYTLGDNAFSESLRYEKQQNEWTKQLISP